ncbi:hypothetical protein VNO77_02976 [Canavalia gladiata]|uniref:Uncharacterized protein n=1 Tax=Canavalia gladiata TaxID=3824 RepID=A0AAN9MTY1_CANGL
MKLYWISHWNTQTSCVQSQEIDEQERHNKLPHETAQNLPLVCSVNLQTFVLLANALLLEMEPTFWRWRTTEEGSLSTISNPPPENFTERI